MIMTSVFDRLWPKIVQVDGRVPRAEAEMVHDVASRIPHDQMIVEVGCARGGITTALAHSGRDVLAVDPAPSQADAAALSVCATENDNVTWARCDAANAPEPLNSVGMLLVGVQRCTASPLRDFERFERRAAPTARVVFGRYMSDVSVKETVGALVQQDRLRVMRSAGDVVVCMRVGVSKAQRGEDQAALRYFAGEKGRFLDVGAWDGVAMSNCRALAEAGWRGVCVEPAVKPFTSLMYNYEGFADVQLVHAAIMPRCGLSRFWDTADALSSFSPRHVNVWRRGAGVPFRQIWTAHVTFQDLFAALPGPYDFVSLDTEGYSVTLLEMIDPVRVGARLVCVENDGKYPVVMAWGKRYGFHEVFKTEENVMLGK